MKAQFSKRCFAYIIDVFIVLVLSSLITGLIPISEKAQNLTETLNDVVNKTTEKEISITEYNKLLKDINYDLSKETIMTSLITIVIYLLYFVVLPMYNNSQTFGKKMMKLELKTSDGGKPTINNLLFRALILYGLANNLIGLILIMFLKKPIYINVTSVLNTFQTSIIVISIVMMIISKDGRGIHDLVGNTVVINKEEIKWENYQNKN